jgi:osmotically-inducible protein OsmY
MKIKSNAMICLGLAAAMSGLTAHADMAQDKAITNQVKSALSKNSDIGTDVNVRTKDGVVYLKGKALTPAAKSHAEELANAVPGVQKVIDDLGTEK